MLKNVCWKMYVTSNFVEFISFNRLFREAMWFSTYKINVICRDYSYLHFQIGIYFFFSPNSLAGVFSTILNRNGGRGHSCLVSDQRQLLSCF